MNNQIGITSGTTSPAPTSKPTSLVDTIRNIEQQIALLGPGPHNTKQKDDLTKLNLLLNRAKLEQRNKMLGKSSSETNTVKGAGVQLTTSSSSPAIHSTSAMSGSAMLTSSHASGAILDKTRLADLVKEVDPLAQLDDDVEEVLMQLADDFIDNIVNSSCLLAKHRRSNVVEVKDVQLHLERNWNMWVPGFGSEEIRPYKKAATTEAHKQRMALIRKTLKKY